MIGCALVVVLHVDVSFLMGIMTMFVEHRTNEIVMNAIKTM